MASIDIIRCTKCNRAISPRDWSTQNVAHGGYDGVAHNDCSRSHHYQSQSYMHFEPSFLENAKVISKLENDHDISKKKWYETKQSLELRIAELQCKINEQESIIHQFQTENESLKAQQDINNALTINITRLQHEIDRLKNERADIIETCEQNIQISETKRKQSESKWRQKQSEWKDKNSKLQQQIHDLRTSRDNSDNSHKSELSKLETMHNEHRSQWSLTEKKLVQQMNVITESYSKIVKDRDELRKQMQMIVDNGDKKPEKHVIKFEKWLKDTVKLSQYIVTFRRCEYNDIRLVSCFEHDILRNEVGIYKALHIKLILSEAMKYKKEQGEFIKWLKFHNLTEYQQVLNENLILTLKDFERDIKNKQHLMEIMDLKQDKVDIIWDVIHNQSFDENDRLNVQIQEFQDEEEKLDMIDDEKLYETPGGGMEDMEDINGINGQMNMLRCDLENYRFDYMEQQCYKRKKRKAVFMLEELRIFYDFQGQIIRDWMNLRCQEYQNLLDKLLDLNIGENKLYDSYSILFELIIGCFNIMQREYKLMKLQDPMSINLIFLNMRKLYIASKVFYIDNYENGNNDKRIENLSEFIEGIIDEIMKNMSNKKYVECVLKNDLIKDYMVMFIIKCCEILWNFIHFGMDLYPKRMMIVKDDRMRCCYFPAVINGNITKTKIWFACDAF